MIRIGERDINDVEYLSLTEEQIEIVKNIVEEGRL